MRLPRAACKFVLALSLPLALAACVAPPTAEGEPTAAIELPARWSAPAPEQAASATGLAAWWQRFGDAELSALVEDALRTSPTVEAAMAALRQSRALADVAAAGLLPSVGATASAQRSGTAAQGSSNRFAAGLNASWEPDLSGGTRAGADAAALDARAAQLRLADVQVSLAAEVALAWIDVRLLHARQAIAQDNLQAQEDTLRIARWRHQVEASKTRELPLLESLHERLAAAIPAQTRPSALAHGDYRFDNTVLGPDRRVSAVLDWELCTIGDPVADFCWSLMYWAEAEDDIVLLPDPPTRLPQFPRRAEVVACYEEFSGMPLENAGYFAAFGWWKQACIVEGVYARLIRGAGGGMKTAPPEEVAKIVERYLARAARALG